MRHVSNFRGFLAVLAMAVVLACSGNLGSASDEASDEPLAGSFSELDYAAFAAATQQVEGPMPQVELASEPSTAVGVVDGSFAVGAAGQATYTIPIQVAPGRNGLNPELALRYDSNSSNGVVGVGWSIAGLSVVSRCSGLGEAPPTATSDGFCLDGSPLVPFVADPQGFPHPPGGLETIYDVASQHGDVSFAGEYATVPDSMRQILRYQVKDGQAINEIWTVMDRSNRVLIYGDPDAVPGDPQNRWPVSWIQDDHGNYMTISYQSEMQIVQDANGNDDEVVGSLRPKEIRYAGNLNSDVEPDRVVRFGYRAKRPDPWAGWGSWTKSHVDLLLSDVQVFGPNDHTTAFRTYRLTYTHDTPGPYAGTGQSRLSTLQECDAANVCKPATTFSWSFGREKYSRRTLSVSDLSKYFAGPFVTDVNGDGRDDVVVSRGDGESQVVGTYLGTDYGLDDNFNPSVIPALAGARPILPIDLNRDGMSDLLLARDKKWLEGWISAGGGWVDSNVSWKKWDELLYLVPFNRKGSTDAVACTWDDDAGRSVWTLISNGEQTLFTPIDTTCQLPGPSYGPCWDCDGAKLVGQTGIRGDETLYYTRIGESYSLSPVYTGQSHMVIGAYPGLSLEEGAPDLAADFNGDSTQDVALWREDAEPFVYLGAGAQGYPELRRQTLESNELESDSQFESAVVADFDQDSRADIFVNSGSQWDILEWSGASAEHEGGFVNIGTTPFPASSDTVLVGDFNGDGALDLIQAEEIGASAPKWVEYQHESATTDVEYGASDRPDLLTGIQDGFGASTRISYLPMTNPEVYTTDRSACVGYRQQCDLDARYLVHQVHEQAFGADMEDPAESWRRRTFAYEDARSDTRTGRSHGFARREVTTEVLRPGPTWELTEHEATSWDVETYTPYDDAHFPFVGFVTSSETRTMLADDRMRVIRERHEPELLWTREPEKKQTWMAAARKTVREDFELSIQDLEADPSDFTAPLYSRTTLRENDPWGRVQTLLIDDSDGYRTVVDSEFTVFYDDDPPIDVHNWPRLQQVARREVTNQVPDGDGQTLTEKRTTEYVYTSDSLLEQIIREPVDLPGFHQPIPGKAKTAGM